MVATAATSAFFAVASLQPESGAKTSGKGGGVPSTVDARGIKSKSASSGSLQVRTNAQAPSKVNGTKFGVVEGLKGENDTPSHHERTIINQLPDWSMLLAAITTIFLAAEKQWMMLDWKPRRPDMLTDPFGLGKIVQDGLVFSQNFSIRSYEVGADRTASIETLMNHLQETALNHVKGAGLLGDGFGATPEMCKKNLIWVVTKMHVVVDRYPTWGDVVQVNSWVAASGKNGMRRDWIVHDCKTGDILTRASSVWVMMNKETRRLSKIPDEVRVEIGPYFVDSPPVLDEDSGKLPKLNESTADYIRTGLTPKRSDLDVNLHVNNVKYVGWIVEILSIEDGTVLKDFNHLLHRNKKVDFIEQFNEKLLVKQDNENLQILDVRNAELKEVSRTEFKTPSAFIFLYENQLFLTFRNRTVAVWNFRGELVTSFEDHLLWHPDCNTNNIYITSDQDLIISYCKADSDDHWMERNAGSINISNILTGKCLAKINAGNGSPKVDEYYSIDSSLKKQHHSYHMRNTVAEALEDITALFYDEERNEIYTGNRHGLVHVWSN